MNEEALHVMLWSELQVMALSEDSKVWNASAHLHTYIRSYTHLDLLRENVEAFPWNQKKCFPVGRRGMRRTGAEVGTRLSTVYLFIFQGFESGECISPSSFLNFCKERRVWVGTTMWFSKSRIKIALPQGFETIVKPTQPFNGSDIYICDKLY